MEIVKKNILSIVCGVIAIAAVVAYFVYVNGSVYPDLEREAKSRETQYNTLVNLIGKNRSLPVVKLDKADASPLPTYPTPPVIERAKQITGKLTGQAKQILAAAVLMNQRPPLVQGVFPNPSDTTKFAFRDAYADFILKDIPKRLNAASPPTLEDVSNAEQKLWDDQYAPKIFFVNGVEANREAVNQEFMTAVGNLREKLQRETAEQHQVYLDQNAVKTNDALWQTEVSPPTPQVWYAQTALWVQTDIVDSIAALNNKILQGVKKKEDRNILNAPIKHIQTIEVPQGTEQFMRITDTSQEGLAAGMSDYMSSPTGRTSGGTYDVIKWTLVVKMDARYLPALIQELGNGRFIAVHKCETVSVDTTLAQEDGFFYGNTPVVQATLTGEALLLRDWTMKLVPEVVKKDLPGAAQSEADAGGTPAAGK
jgi:hypothetical protein